MSDDPVEVLPMLKAKLDDSVKERDELQVRAVPGGGGCGGQLDSMRRRRAGHVVASIIEVAACKRAAPCR